MVAEDGSNGDILMQASFLEEKYSVCGSHGDCGCSPFDSKGNHSHYFSALVDCECSRMRVERINAIR